MSTILNATDVTVRYNDRAILDAATLAIDEGQRIGLVGRNGCGKTTFLKLLTGLQSPDGGDISRRRDLLMSYLAQDFLLDPALDVRANVRAGAKHVLDLIAEFEALPADSKRHEELEHRIAALAFLEDIARMLVIDQFEAGQERFQLPVAEQRKAFDSAQVRGL